MKLLISLLIVLVVGLVSHKVWQQWEQAKERRVLEEKAARGTDINPESLSGLPNQLQYKLKEAQDAGPETFKRFIDSCKRFPDVKDPRLAWMELDYVVMISQNDPVEAKKIFWEVKKRTPADSPIMPRIKALEKTYD
jgi:hypothetical protein